MPTKPIGSGSNTPKPTSPKPVAQAPANTSPTPKVQDSANIIPLNKAEQSPTESEPAIPPALVIAKGSKGRKKVGGLSNLDDLLANVKQQEKEKKENVLDWTIENIDRLWKEYIATLDTNSTIIALGSAKLTLEGDNKINVVTPNKLNTETIKKEMDLIEKIRDSYQDRELVFEMKDDIGQFPELVKVDKVKKTKTNDEKLNILIEKNPSISDFIKRFDLKVDK